MIKLKDYISEYAKMIDSYDEVESFLKDFRSKNPQANEDEIADAIVRFLYQRNREVDESIALTAMKYILPALMTVYGGDATKIADTVKNKLKHKITYASPVKEKDVSSKMNYWVKKYAKRYGANERAMFGVLRRETSFTGSSKHYNPNQIGDKNNVLGPSYGPAQIKLVTAKEIYTDEPESDVSVGSITNARLTNDVEFNIRTLAKLLSHYYNKDFKKIKNPQDRLAHALTAYSSGLTAAKTRGVNRYGRIVSKGAVG